MTFGMELMLILTKIFTLDASRKILAESEEFDMDSDGNIAPVIQYSSYKDVTRFFSQFREVKIEQENFNDTYIPFFRLFIPRKPLLHNFAKIFGLDYYIVAKK